MVKRIEIEIIMKQLKSKEIKSLRKYILKKQKGQCWICGKIPKIACLDHHHKKKIKGTGQIRGVLCSNCNVFIAKVETYFPQDAKKILSTLANAKTTLHYLPTCRRYQVNYQ